MWSVIGHNQVVSSLQRGLERGTLAHAYLFAGPPHIGKMTLAITLAQALNCEAEEPPCGECISCQKIALSKHADIQIIGLGSGGNSVEPKPRAEIGIDRVRQMQLSASLPPFEGRYKVFIIDEAEFLSIEAANCLLKTLEEPIGKVIFILLAAKERLLPATVVSRCQRLELPPLTAAEVESALISRRGVAPQKARLLAKLSRGCLGWAISAVSDSGLLQQRTERLNILLDITSADYDERFAYAAELAAQFGQSRRLVQDTLDLWLEWWRDLLLVKAGCAEAITNIDLNAALADQARAYTLAEIKTVIDGIQTSGEHLKLNANPRLVLEVLMLSIPRKEARGEISLTSRFSSKHE